VFLLDAIIICMSVVYFKVSFIWLDCCKNKSALNSSLFKIVHVLYTVSLELKVIDLTLSLYISININYLHVPGKKIPRPQASMLGVQALKC